MGNPPSGLEIIVQIKDGLDGNVLAEDSIDADKWKITGSGKWVLFDFDDIIINPENTYYIVCSGGGGDPSNVYCWYFDIENPYSRGIAFRTDDGVLWKDLEDLYPPYPEIDFTFITYCGEPPDDSYRLITNNYNKNLIYDHLSDDNTQLEWMIAGEGLRCIRFYQIHVPPSYDGSVAIPLVIALHGSTATGRYFNPAHIIWFYQDIFFEDYTDFSEKADLENFIVVYPKALLFYSPEFMFHLFAFNVPVYPDGWYRGRNLIDDVGFIEDLIDKMTNSYNIDTDRVYLSGLSNGADMTYTLGCMLSDKISAISVVAGEIAKKDEDDVEFSYPPDPKNPMPVIVFHGTADSSYPWDGDEWGCGVELSIQFWVEKNSCNSEPEIYESDTGNIIRYIYSDGVDGSEVILYKSINGTHCWPGNDYDDSSSAPWLIDRIKEISATDLIWEFFESHPKQ
jgi:polyhydroxybutyrate depolymerase